MRWRKHNCLMRLLRFKQLNECWGIGLLSQIGEYPAPTPPTPCSPADDSENPGESRRYLAPGQRNKSLWPLPIQSYTSTLGIADLLKSTCITYKFEIELTHVYHCLSLFINVKCCAFGSANASLFSYWHVKCTRDASLLLTFFTH